MCDVFFLFPNSSVRRETLIVETVRGLMSLLLLGTWSAGVKVDCNQFISFMNASKQVKADKIINLHLANYKRKD